MFWCRMSCEPALFWKGGQLLPASDGVRLKESGNKRMSVFYILEHCLKLRDDIERLIWILARDDKFICNVFGRQGS